MTPDPRPQVARRRRAEGPVLVVGSGPVGQALAAAWARAGVPLLCASRSPRRAAAWVRSLAPEARPGSGGRGGVEAVSLEAGLARCATGVLAVHDEALDAVAAAAAGVPGGGRVLLHTNGFRGPEALAAARDQGWRVGKLHPLRALAPSGAFRIGARGGGLAGSSWAVAGDPPAARRARALVAAAGGRALALAAGAEASARCHTAASLLSGGAVALFAAADALLAPAVASPAERRRALAALLASTAENLAAAAPGRALTGPAARGAVGIVREQLALLRRLDPDAAELYARLVARQAELALAAGRLDPERASALRALAAGRP